MFKRGLLRGRLERGIALVEQFLREQSCRYRISQVGAGIDQMHDRSVITGTPVHTQTLPLFDDLQFSPGVVHQLGRHEHWHFQRQGQVMYATVEQQIGVHQVFGVMALQVSASS